MFVINHSVLNKAAKYNGLGVKVRSLVATKNAEISGHQLKYYHTQLRMIRIYLTVDILLKHSPTEIRCLGLV